MKSRRSPAQIALVVVPAVIGLFLIYGIVQSFLSKKPPAGHDTAFHPGVPSQPPGKPIFDLEALRYKGAKQVGKSHMNGMESRELVTADSIKAICDQYVKFEIPSPPANAKTSAYLKAHPFKRPTLPSFGMIAKNGKFPYLTLGTSYSTEHHSINCMVNQTPDISRAVITQREGLETLMIVAVRGASEKQTSISMIRSF